MPNHLHCILYFPEAGFGLDKILFNGRFIAYEIVNRLSLQMKQRPQKLCRMHLRKGKRRKNNYIKSSKILLMPKQFFQKISCSETCLSADRLNYIRHNLPTAGRSGKRNMEFSRRYCLL